MQTASEKAKASQWGWGMRDGCEASGYRMLFHGTLAPLNVGALGVGDVSGPDQTPCRPGRTRRSLYVRLGDLHARDPGLQFCGIS